MFATNSAAFAEEQKKHLMKLAKDHLFNFRTLAVLSNIVSKKEDELSQLGGRYLFQVGMDEKEVKDLEEKLETLSNFLSIIRERLHRCRVGEENLRYITKQFASDVISYELRGIYNRIKQMAIKELFDKHITHFTILQNKIDEKYSPLNKVEGNRLIMERKTDELIEETNPEVIEIWYLAILINACSHKLGNLKSPMEGETKEKAEKCLDYAKKVSITLIDLDNMENADRWNLDNIEEDDQEEEDE